MGGRIGVLVEVNCETDFVAKTEEFKQLVRISRCTSLRQAEYVSREDVPAEAVARERKIFAAAALNEGKLRTSSTKLSMVEWRSFCRKLPDGAAVCQKP